MLGRLLAERFQIEEFIAEGGMGAVYRGHDMQTGEIVAIKVLRSEVITETPEMLERFVREGETLRRLNHPNIVKMLGAFETDGQYCLVMDYIRGGSLRDLLKKEGRLSVERVVALALELADALARTHHLKIIHRDIKPDNILIAE